MRMRTYFERLKGGRLAPRAETTIVSDAGATLLLDGGEGIGQVVAERAMRLTIERAKLHGIACVGVRRSNHLGALAYYSTMAIADDLIGFAASGTAPTVAPWGGLTRLLSNSPWSIAFPAGEEPPIVVDMDSTAMNVWKVRDLAARGETLPPGVALNDAGEPTDDPVAALKGLILPAGRHKGYGIAVAMEVLTSVLTGALYSTSVPGSRDSTRPQGVGHLMLAIKVDQFIPIGEFKARVDDYVRRLRSSQTAPGVERIFVPGERSALLAAERRVSGIPLRGDTLGILRGVAEELSIAPPC